MADRENAQEGADPSRDVERQNPGETTTSDLAGRTSDTDGGDDASGGEATKTQDAAKAGREGFDPDAGEE